MILVLKIKWGLGPSIWIWGKWAQNRFWDITRQPPVRFSQTNPHFVQNFMKRTGIFFLPEIQTPKGPGPQYRDLGQTGPKLFFGRNLATTCQIFTNNSSFCSKFYDQHFSFFFFLKFQSDMGTGSCYEDLGEMGPKWFLGHNLATTCQIFPYNPSFYSEFHEKDWTFFY